MRRIDLLWLSLMAAESQHGERDFILAVRGQAPHGFQGFFEQFCHDEKIWPNRPKWKGIRQYLTCEDTLSVIVPRPKMPAAMPTAGRARPAAAGLFPQP